MEGQKFTVELEKIIKEFKLEIINQPENMNEILICNNEVNRPSLQMAGYFDYFDNTRIQVFGMVEASYIGKMSDDKLRDVLEKFFEKDVPCVIFTRNLEIPDVMKEVAATSSSSVNISRQIHFLKNTYHQPINVIFLRHLADF